MSALAARAAAQADFGAAFNLSTDAANIGPEVAVEKQGNAQFVWREAFSALIQTRRRSADGKLGPVRTVSEQSANPTPHVVIARDGTAYFVWSRLIGGGHPDVVEARRLAPDGTFGPITTISDPTTRAADPALAMTDTGPTIVWVGGFTSNQRVQTRRMHADGTLDGLFNVSDPGYNVSAPHVVVNSAGSITVAWNWQGMPDTGGTLPPSVAQTETDNGAIKTLGGADKPGFLIDMAVDSRGLAHIVYTSDGHVVVARSTAGSVEPGIQLADDASGGVSVAAGTDGTVRFAWLGADGAGARPGRTRARARHGTLGPIDTISPEGFWAPVVAVDPAGNADFVWTQSLDKVHITPRARRLRLDRTLQPVHDLAAAYSGSAPQSNPGVDVAAGSDGTVVAIWERGAGNDRVSLQGAALGGCGSDAEASDSDGDGLCDGWEHSGIDADGDGTPDFELPGAD